MKIMKYSVVAMVVGLLFVSGAFARPDKDWKEWYGHVAIGYADPQGDAGDVVKGDLSISGGVTWWRTGTPVGLEFDFGFTEMDMRREVLEDVDASGGRVEVWNLGAAGVWATDSSGPVNLELSAGIGGYHLDGKLTEPGLWGGIICPPWSWYCYPGMIPGDLIVASESTTKFGWNVGAGLVIGLQSGSQLFFKVKYHSISTKQTTEYMPIIIGYRW